MKAREHTCPTCNVPPGEACWNMHTGRRMRQHHRNRELRAERAELVARLNAERAAGDARARERSELVSAGMFGVVRRRGESS